MYLLSRPNIVDVGTNLGVRVRGSIRENLLLSEMSNFCTKEKERLINSFGNIFPMVVINKSNDLLYFGR